MPRGIPNKKKDIVDEIENEMNSNVAVAEEPKIGEVSISKENPEAKGSNEFGDEYTMEVIADNEPGADLFRIPSKDPKFEYRYLRDDTTNMNIKTSNLLYLKGGWQVVPVAHLLRIGFKKEFLQPDGSYKVGELVLAFMPKELFLKKMKEETRKRDGAMAGVQAIVDGKTRVNHQGVNGIGKGTLKRGPIDYGSHNSIEE
jgi:hypothetical protein